MRYPFGLVLDSTKHILNGKLRGNRNLVVGLSLDPLGECADSCGHTLHGTNGQNGFVDDRPMLTVEQCLGAMRECPAPIISICGGEPLEYPDIAALSREILSRGKHLFLCTDGMLIRRRMHMIPPFTNFFWNVRLEGTEGPHDQRVDHAGVFREAMDGVRAAKNAGFFVVVTTTIYPDTDVRDVGKLYDTLHAMHVDGYLILPPVPEEILGFEDSAADRQLMHERFRQASELLGAYNLMVSPVYLEYLRGERELDWRTWGSPAYGPKGWSAPYLQKVGYQKSYADLLQHSVSENYGPGIAPRGETSTCHSGFEMAALMGANPKAGDIWKMLTWQLRGSLGEKRGRVWSA